MLICHHSLLVFLAILLRVVQAGSSESLNSTDGDRLVLSFEAVANLIWKSAYAIFLPQFGICTANHQKKPLIFTSTSRNHTPGIITENQEVPSEPIHGHTGTRGIHGHTGTRGIHGHRGSEDGKVSTRSLPLRSPPGRFRHPCLISFWLQTCHDSTSKMNWFYNDNDFARGNL